MRGLPAHHSPADDALGVLHGNAALTALDQHNERYDCHHHHQDDHHLQHRPLMSDKGVGVHVADGRR